MATASGPSNATRLWYWAGYAAAAAWVGAMLFLAETREDSYDRLMQEDRVVEWATVGLFAAAGLLRLGPALRRRRLFDLLVALFCLFVAGEEMSWGQRLVGYQSPATFLEHNAQQEATLHNLEFFGRPKWPLAAALAGYGILLPFIAGVGRRAPGGASRWEWVERLFQRLGVSTPTAALTPWFIAAVGLLVWYPVTFTGEWVEALAGALFVAAAASAGTALTARAVAGLILGSVGFGLGMTRVSDLVAGRAAKPSLVACAQAEARALAHDLTSGNAATPRLVRASGVHKRLWTSVNDGYIDRARLASFDGLARCAHETDPASLRRRRFMADPWGTAYWLRLSGETELQAPGATTSIAHDSIPAMRPLVVYSFGADRRRDVEEAQTAGGDIIASGRLPRERRR